MVTSTSTDGIGAPAWAIRPEEPIDIDLIHELHRAAFSGPAEAELVDAIRSGSDFLPDLSLVAATDDGSILGHILVSRIRLEVDDPEIPRLDVLALAPLAVLPPHQGRGIGEALMRGALTAADTREEPLMVVVGSPAFYGRFGFVPATSVEVTGPYAEAGDAFQVRPRPGIAEEEVPSGTVVYPATFAAV